MKKKFILIILIYSQLNYTASAEDVKVQINGAILSQSCNIRSGDLIKNVIFDDINPQDFTSLGSTTPPKEVSIALINCTGNVNDMTYTFSGINDETNPSLLKITGKSNTPTEDLATGLAIEILDMNKKAISLNDKQNFNQPITTSSYDFKFYLRYKSTSSTIGAGDASSILYLDFYYE